MYKLTRLNVVKYVDNAAARDKLLAEGFALAASEKSAEKTAKGKAAEDGKGTRKAEAAASDR